MTSSSSSATDNPILARIVHTGGRSHFAKPQSFPSLKKTESTPTPAEAEPAQSIDPAKVEVLSASPDSKGSFRRPKFVGSRQPSTRTRSESPSKKNAGQVTEGGSNAQDDSSNVNGERTPKAVSPKEPSSPTSPKAVSSPTADVTVGSPKADENVQRLSETDQIVLSQLKRLNKQTIQEKPPVQLPAQSSQDKAAETYTLKGKRKSRKKTPSAAPSAPQPEFVGKKLKKQKRQAAPASAQSAPSEVSTLASPELAAKLSSKRGFEDPLEKRKRELQQKRELESNRNDDVVNSEVAAALARRREKVDAAVSNPESAAPVVEKQQQPAPAPRVSTLASPELAALLNDRREQNKSVGSQPGDASERTEEVARVLFLREDGPAQAAAPEAEGAEALEAAAGEPEEAGEAAPVNEDEVAPTTDRPIVSTCRRVVCAALAILATLGSAFLLVVGIGNLATSAFAIKLIAIPGLTSKTVATLYVASGAALSLVAYAFCRCG